MIKTSALESNFGFCEPSSRMECLVVSPHYSHVLRPQHFSTCPLYTYRPPLPHGAAQGPDSSGASGGRVVHAGATPGPV